MTTLARRIPAFLAAFGVALFIGAAQAIAQEVERPPTPQGTDSPPRWMYYGVIALLVAAAAFVNVLPAKRGHLD